MSNQNIGSSGGEHIKTPFSGEQRQSTSPYQTQPDTGTERRRLTKTERRERGGSSVLDFTPSSATLTPEPMGIVEGSGQGIPGVFSPAQRLDQQLESAGAYERVEQLRDGARRRRMLQNYITTPKSAADIGEDEGIQNRTIAHQLIRSAMDVAFFALPEDQRAADYDNNPEVAWRISAEQKTHTKGEKIKEALDKYRNPETGKVEFSETHRQNVTAANQRRGEQIREGTYTGNPVGRPRNSKNLHRWKMHEEREKRLRALRAEDQPLEQHYPQDGNTPT